VISSDDSDFERDDFSKEVKELAHKDAGVRMFAAGNMMRILKSYTDKRNPINPLDKQLIKGFYTTNRWELENDQIAEDVTSDAVADNRPSYGEYLQQPVQAVFEQPENAVGPSLSSLLDETGRSNRMMESFNKKSLKWWLDCHSQARSPHIYDLY